MIIYIVFQTENYEFLFQKSRNFNSQKRVRSLPLQKHEVEQIIYLLLFNKKHNNFKIQINSGKIKPISLKSSD